MGQKQLNVRLNEDIFDVLEAMAFIEGVSLPDVIRPVIEALALEARSEPAIQLALRARAESMAVRSGKLSRIPSRGADS
ncbi:MAG TPA: hypothetical protein VMD79_08885 [Solirubrobacteraceae bacterium]|nr:hypothetical protein [Solirubrobacteraceae bacterium]